MKPMNRKTKRVCLLLTALLSLLAGCTGAGGGPYSLCDGRYVHAPAEDPAALLPYILIHDGRFTVVTDVAVSYQPSGSVSLLGNELVLEGRFAGEAFCCVFTLIADDTFRFERGRSTVLPGRAGWTDGMIFRPADDGTADSDPETLRELFPAYFGLDASDGLDVIVWQMAPQSYSFGLLEHAEEPRDWLSPELMGLRGTDAGQMRAILSAYDVGEDDIFILPWQNPISSYIPEYRVNSEGEEDMEATEQAYIAGIRGMLFG